MGGKGKSSTPPPPDTVEPPDQNMDALIAMMGQMLTLQAQQLAQPPEPPMPPILPPIDSGPDVDWTEQNRELAAKARADYNVEEARRKGTLDTILTSPLLDDEEAQTTSILAG